MSVKICHISDWHGKLKMLPEADIYVITGDMYPTFPLLKIASKRNPNERRTWDPYDLRSAPPSAEEYVDDRVINPTRESELQMEWAIKNPFRKNCLPESCREANVICLRGNHEFEDLLGWVRPGSINRTFEIHNRHITVTIVLDDGRELTFGGARGIPMISGEWSDEMDEPRLNETFRDLNDNIDVLVTHAPPSNVLDGVGTHYGSSAIGNYIQRRAYTSRPLRTHLFGHVHESFGEVKIGDTLFSNASRGWRIIEL